MTQTIDEQLTATAQQPSHPPQVLMQSWNKPEEPVPQAFHTDQLMRLGPMQQQQLANAPLVDNIPNQMCNWPIADVEQVPEKAKGTKRIRQSGEEKPVGTPCQVCGDATEGGHYFGAIVCLPCKVLHSTIKYLKVIFKYEAFSLTESPHFWLKQRYTNWANISFALDELICL